MAMPVLELPPLPEEEEIDLEIDDLLAKMAQGQVSPSDLHRYEVLIIKRAELMSKPRSVRRR